MNQNNSYNQEEPNFNSEEPSQPDNPTFEPVKDVPASDASGADASVPDASDADASSGITSNIESSVSNLSNKSSEIASNVKESTSELVSKLNVFRETSSGKIITITVIGIIVVGVIAAILYYIIHKTMISQTSYILKETKAAPVVCSKITNCEGSRIPNASSGVRSALSFWIYIYDISKYKGSIRHVLHRGTKNDSFEVGGSLPNGPYVALDPDTSAMSILFGPNTESDKYFSYSIPNANGKDMYKDTILEGRAKTAGASATLTPSAYEKWQVASQCRGIVFPYIPLQRWVHVACVINENVNGGTITGYIDGELSVNVTSSTKSTPVEVSTGTSKKKIYPVSDISNINMTNTGDVYIGGSVSDAIGPGFSGLVSKVQFYNYDLSAKDVYASYQSGPIDNLLAKLGLPAYGIQSPVYKIE